VFKLTLKGLFQHKIRFLLTTIAVVAGVSFVVAAFTLTDSVRAQFNQLFSDINANIDINVRAEERFDTGAFGVRQPIDESLLPQVREVDGVAAAQGTAGGLPALVIDPDGEAVSPTGGPPLGINWVDDIEQLFLRDGSAPAEDDQVVFDERLFDAAGYQIGDTVIVQTPLGNGQYELVGTFSFGEANSLAGAYLVGFTTLEAQEQFNLVGKFQEIQVAVEDGADPVAVQQAIAATLPPGIEAVPTEQVVTESQDDIGSIVDIFGTVLLVFAFISLFVACFLIFNTFLIVVGQRIREMALLRAVGASTGQVFRSILGEALVVGLIASVIGFFLGLVLSIGLNAILNAAGFGGGNTELVVAPTSIIAAFAVGVGATLLSAILPAIWATRIPPVAAMREGFRLSLGTVRTLAIFGTVLVVLGGAGITWSLTTDPDTAPLFIVLGAGALMVFIGVALLSAALATPVSRLLGLPFRRLYGATGELARQNAAREPSRTAFTAAALMIGLALVSMSFVVGDSLRASFVKTLGTSVTADWYVGSDDFFGFSSDIATQMSELPELEAVSGVRQDRFLVGDSVKTFSAINFDVANDLLALDIIDGEITPTEQGVILAKDPADELGIAAGDVLTVVFQETGSVDLPVLAIYEDSSVLGNWAIDMDTYDANFTARNDFLVVAKQVEGADPTQVRAAIEQIAEPFPQVNVEDKDEFTASQEEQLNVLLAVIFVFLLMTIVIAFIGILNTLALSVFERTRELGLLRAVGMARKQARRMIRVEAVIVSVFGALLGIIVGVVLGVALSIAIPDDVISVVQVPWINLVFVVLLAALFGVLAALYPAWRAGRLNILDAIASE
jgi:putative ABC transport system permease protein